MFHRSIEAPQTAKILKVIFPDPLYFIHHSPLPYGEYFNDEGAANHTRFCHSHRKLGVHLFVYGQKGLMTYISPEKFPARQTVEASQAVARSHQIYPERIVFAQLNPEAIDAGVFHNDLISIGNGNFFMYHEKAFLDKETVIEEIRTKVSEYCDTDMVLIEVPEDRITLLKAVTSYMFNSQIVTLPDDSMAIFAPTECQRIPGVGEFLEELSKNPDTPIRDIHYFNLRQSMRNGGGPACLRLRVVLTQNELNTINRRIILTDRLYPRLVDWVNKHYRDRLEPKDLADPNLVDETQAALHELTRILDLGNIYDFQG